MSDYEKSIQESICSNCHIGFLNDHPTNASYKKCPICGFCKLIKKKEISNEDKPKRVESYKSFRRL